MATLKYDHDYQTSLPRIITGWGRTAGGQPASKELLAAELTTAHCDNYYINAPLGWICAGDRYRGGCQGDSGGPLHSHDGHVLGLVSFGRLESKCQNCHCANLNGK